MSSNPALGHLYHDDSISNALTLLDVQEKMKTRAINAREAKFLDRYNRSIDKERCASQRRNEWEQRILRKQLKTIEWKTPSLNRSLRIESERQKNYSISRSATELVLPKVQINGSVVTNDNETSENKMIRVSSWSVYSNRRAQVYSAPQLNKSDSEFETKLFRPRYSPDFDDHASKSATFVRKANLVTKSLHKLYTNSLERKLKEQQTTVLDVLGKESKEELEKALFALRGTTAGDLIEGILKDKEYVSSKEHKGSDTNTPENDKNFVEFPMLTKETSVRSTSDSRDNSIDAIAVANANNSDTSARSDLTLIDINASPSMESLSPDSNGNITSNSGSITSLASIPARKFLKHRQNRRSTVDNNELFERDDSYLMSSTVANVSDTGAVPNALRWTDIFKTPELWKQGKRGRKSHVKKVVSLITLTGKRRHTLMKNRS